MEQLRVFPHVEQIKGPNDWSCGAASLAMLYKQFGFNDTHDDIWNDVLMRSLINPNERICQTIKMAQNLMRHGLRTTIFSVSNVKGIFKYCLDNNLELLFLYRQTIYKQTGHFVLLTNAEDDYIYINDPFLSSKDGVNVKMRIADVQRLMESPKSEGRLLGNNVLIASGRPNERTRVKSMPCPYCHEDSYTILALWGKADKFMCPVCGHVFHNKYKSE